MSIMPLLRRCLARCSADDFGDLTRPQYEVLAAISANPSATQHRLVEITEIDRSTMSDMLIRLDAKGFITRERSDTDSRVWRSNLTALGKAKLAGAHKLAKKAEADLLKPLKAPERKALAGFLSRMTGGAT